MKRRVVIYVDKPLIWTQTFIRGQVECMREFEPVYFGCRRPLPEQSLDPGSTRVETLCPNYPADRMREVLYKLGVSYGEAVQKVGAIGPQLIHAHGAHEGVRIQPVAQALGIPLLTTCHGSDVLKQRRAIRTSSLSFLQYVLKRKRFQRTGNGFLAVSKFLHRELLRQGFPEERCIQHYIGVDLSAFHPVAKRPDVPMVVFVGRLIENKGCAYLIRAMAEVQKRIPDASLVVIGDGALRPELEELARSLRVQANFVGKATPDQVRAWLRKATLLSVPSVTAQDGSSESFGMVFVEAQATGVPVVSTQVGGIPEAVVHGETGLLARERNHLELSEYMLTLLESESLWEQFSKRARRHVERNFDLRRQTGVLEGMYAALCSGAELQEAVSAASDDAVSQDTGTRKTQSIA